MTIQINFPTDWTQMSEEGVAENIKYLTKNRKKCNVRVIDENTMLIDNVRITFYTIEQHRQMIKVAKINDRNVRSDQNEDLYLAIKKLYDVCKQDKVKEYEKSVRKEGNLGAFGTSVLVASILLITLIIANAEMKKQDKEKQEKAEFVKEILKAYEQERSKTGTVNIDSLINQYVR